MPLVSFYTLPLLDNIRKPMFSTPRCGGTERGQWHKMGCYYYHYQLWEYTSQLTFTCSKSTIETRENNVKYVQNKNTRTTSLTSFWWRHWCRSGVFIVNFEHFARFSNVSIVNFEQVNVSWVSVISTLLLPLRIFFNSLL